MVFIVSHHAIVHGFSLGNLKVGTYDSNTSTNILATMNAFFVVAVNVFFIISGYFGVKRNIRKIFSIHVEEVIYVLIAIGIIQIISASEWQSIILALVPERYYWFVFVYIIIILISPYLELVIKYLYRMNEYKIFLFSAFLIIIIFDFILGCSFLGFSKGYSLLNGLFMYFIGALLREKRLGNNKERLASIMVYILLSLCTGCLALMLMKIGKQSIAWNMYSYSSPLVMASSIALFLTFVGIANNSLYSKIRIISSGVLSTYLLTEYWPMREEIYKPVVLFASKSGPFLSILLFAVGLVLVCTIFDIIRRKIFRFFLL